MACRSGVTPPLAAGGPAAIHPAAVAMICMVPLEVLVKSILPSAPTGTTTRLAMVWPGVKNRLAVPGAVALSAIR